ncbi:hypothetical protein TNCV_1254951 [Trichonephila clavipes]|nr:hypothetical protein TNCV_1254951 [Trichonephila clavipes]
MTYIRCPVRLYIPNPLRYFQGQRYGHSKNVCRGQPTCPRCGESGHDSTDCIRKEQCLNCKEAWRVVLSRAPVSGKSYAGVARKGTSDKSIQCNVEKDNSSDSVTPTKPEVIASSKSNSPTKTKVIAKPTSKSPPPAKIKVIKRTESDSPRRPKSRRAGQRDQRPTLTRIPQKVSRDFHRIIEEDTLTGDCSEEDEALIDYQSGP